MKKFMLLYKGPATPAEKMNPDEVQKVMQAWGAWMERVGKSMVDMGQPMDPRSSASVKDDGSEGKTEQLNGYTVISAESLDEAKKLVEGHPFLSDKSGEFSVDVYELLPTPEM